MLQKLSEYDSQLILEETAPEEAPAEEEKEPEVQSEDDKYYNLKDGAAINKEITDLQAKIDSDVKAAEDALK
jgi:hypothetical protein